jgi:hypothetical protein
MMPITGIPLPFLSYGACSMLTNLVAVGLILSVNVRGRKIVSSCPGYTNSEQLEGGYDVDQEISAQYDEENGRIS